MLDAAGSCERDLGDALCGYERTVLAQWDSGASPAAIARDTGHSIKTVRDIVDRYDDRLEARVPPRLVAANQAFVAAELRALERSRVKRQILEVGDIELLLEDRIESLVADLLPNAVKEANEMCVGSLAGEKGQSLRIHIGSGSKRGWWTDFSDRRQKGDALKLIAGALFGDDIAKAVAWAKSWLHLDELDPGRIEQHRLEARARSEQRAQAVIEEAAQKRRAAVRRWHQGVPLSRGDLVDRYLAARGIDLGVLQKAPGALRFHEKLQYGFPPKGTPALLLPAMVAMVTNLAGEHVATHRTYLDPARPAKAGSDVLGFDRAGRPNDAKKIMGAPLGGHIPLWKGAHQQPLKDIPDGTDVFVSEGIEDGLTVACARPDLRVICMVALGYLEALELPPQMGRLVILKQNDAEGSDAARMLARAVAHHRAAGRRVGFVEPPKGVKDLNDLARGVV